MNPVTDVEVLLQAAATDPTAREPFYRLLLPSWVLVLGTYEGGMEDGHAAEGGKVNLFNLEYELGKYGLAFFTSENALNVFVEAMPSVDRRYLTLECKAFFEMTRGATLVLNPAYPFGKVFVPGEVESLLNGTEFGVTKNVVQEPTEILVGAPARVPAGLLDVLTSFFTDRLDVLEATLGWIQYPDKSQGYVLTVRSDNEAAAMHGFGSLGITDWLDGNTLDVMVESTKKPKPTLASVKPFYKRTY